MRCPHLKVGSICRGHAVCGCCKISKRRGEHAGGSVREQARTKSAGTRVFSRGSPLARSNGAHGSKLKLCSSLRKILERFIMSRRAENLKPRGRTCAVQIRQNHPQALPPESSTADTYGPASWQNIVTRHTGNTSYRYQFFVLRVFPTPLADLPPTLFHYCKLRAQHPWKAKARHLAWKHNLKRRYSTAPRVCQYLPSARTLRTSCVPTLTPPRVIRHASDQVSQG